MKQERIEKTLALMKKAGLESVIYAVGANFQYLTDSYDLYWQRACMTNIAGKFSGYTQPEYFLYLTKEGKLTIFTNYRNSEYFLKKYKGICEVVVTYMDQFEDALAPYVHEKKIGLGFPCNQFFKDLFQEIDKEVEFVDAEDLIWTLRVIKDEDEILMLRKLAKFTDDACMYVAKNLKEGMTQREAENLLIEYGIKHHLQDLSFPPTVGFKTRHTVLTDDVENYDREWKLVPGTGIAFDVGYMNNGYCSDWGRTLYFGKAPERMKAAYKALQAGQVHMINSIVPGKTNVNELYDLVHEKVTELGFGPDLRFPERGGLGHQIGIDCHEFPMVNRGSDFILQPGMVFASEPKMWFPDEMYMRVEDMVLVTETGAESLSTFDRELFEL